MHALILMTVLAQWAPREAPHYGHVRESRRMGNRSLVGQGYAFFEFAPASGAGMTSACACTTPTGATGEALTFTRTGSATCSKQGLATTGIANGDLVVCSDNQPRVEPGADGVMALRVEGQTTNLLLRFIAYEHAAWSDVGTPSLTAGQASPWTGDYAASAVTIGDNDGAAHEGRSQIVAVSAGAAHTMHCYVKAGTATSAAISLDGTQATITELSGSWSIVSVTDTSSSSASIVAQILVGDAPAVEGSVTWGGCQVQTGTSASSIVPTEGATATRFADGSMSLSVDPVGPSISVAATFTFFVTGTGVTQIVGVGSAPSRARIDRRSDVSVGYILNTTTVTPTVPSLGSTQHRMSLSDNGLGERMALLDGQSYAPPAASMGGGATTITFGPVGAHISRVCVDPAAARCR